MEPDEQTVRRLEDARYDALISGDHTAFAAMCHPRLLYTHSSGGTDTLATLLPKLEARFYVYHSIDHPIDRIVIEGDVALVLGEMNADITAGGVDKQLRNKCLAVWLRTGSTWQFLAYQPSRLG